MDNIEIELARRELARRKLLEQMRFMFEHYYNAPFIEGWHHAYICEHLEATFKGEIRFLIVNMPPSYGKTEMCVRQFVPYALGRNPSTKMIYTSYSDELSKKVSGEAREIVRSKVYGNLHKFKISPSQDQKHHWQTQEGGLLFATSTGGTVTGVHANIVIVDDPLKVNESCFASARNESWRYFSESITSRLLKDGKTIIIMQRLHPDDIVGRVLREMPSSAYTHLCLRAIESRPLVYDFKNIHYERAAGEALCEGWQNREEVEMIRLRMGEKGFKTQYLQDPEISEAGFFEKGQQREINALEAPECNLYMFIDPAMSLKDSSDERAIVVCGWSKDSSELETCVVYECDAGIWNLESFIEHIINMMLRYREARVLIESDGGGLLLYQSLLPEINRTNAKLAQKAREPLNHRIETFAAPRKTSKNQRIIGMHTYFVSGQLQFVRGGNGIEALLGELFAFDPDNPNNRDNRIDALSHSFNQRGTLVIPYSEEKKQPIQKRQIVRRTWNV